MKTETLVEVRHILQFMEGKGVHVLLSQELRQELDLREYPGFPENWDGEQQPENVYGEPIDFALSVGGDGTSLSWVLTAVTSAFSPKCRRRIWMRFCRN